MQSGLVWFSDITSNSELSYISNCLSQFSVRALFLTVPAFFYWVQVVQYNITHENNMSCHCGPQHDSTTGCIQSISTLYCHQLKLVLFLSSLHFLTEKGKEQISPSLICSGNYWKAPTEREAIAYRCGMTYSHTGPKQKETPLFYKCIQACIDILAEVPVHSSLNGKKRETGT